MKFAPLFSLLLAAFPRLLLGSDDGTSPNIVHIVADDLGWNDVGFHGSEIKTPHLDSLSRDSIELTRFYVTPVCSPTRAGILTGRYPFRFGIFGGVCTPTTRHGIPPSELTIPELLARAGYKHRALMGKWHLGHASTIFHPLNHGFTHFYGHYNGAIDYFSRHRHGTLDWHRDFEPVREKGYSTDLIGKAASSFIRAHAGKGPFHLMVAFNAPHSPLQAKEDDLNEYQFESSSPRVKNTVTGIARKEKAPNYGKVGRGNSERQTFAAMTTAMDRNIGLILNALEEKNLNENTLLIFHSDNGGIPKHGGNNAPFRGNKFTTWEGGVRVVCLIRWPGVINNTGPIDQATAYIDILPTIANIVNLPLPDQVDGVSLLPVLTRKEQLKPRSIILGPKTVVSEDWKLVDGQLFRLDHDPQEKNDLSETQPKIAAELQSHLIKFNEFEGPKFKSKLPNPSSWPPPEWKIPAER